MKSSVLFLLGSGVSIPGGFPTTSSITSQVLTGNNIIRHTDSRYYSTSSPTELDKFMTNEYLPKVLLLLQSIKELMESYDKTEPINYEILYYFIQQLHSYESGEQLNMALYPFIKAVKQKMQGKNTEKPSRLIEIFGEAENYIRHTVWHQISNIPVNKHSHLAFITDAINDKDISVVNIATLNHDLLIEQHLSENKISYHDGFGSTINGVRYWENLFSDKNNLLKVHGSINWFTLQPDDGGWFDDNIGIVLNGDIDHAKSPKGGLMRSTPDKEPHILVGTFNKIYEYTESVFSDIYYHFRTLLKGTNRLVVSGYSFGDKGVNSAILEWLYSNRKNIIIVIHRDPNTLLGNTARNAIRKAFNGIAHGNFTLISKTIENTSWKDIKARI